MIALARRFAGRTDLDLGDQVAFFGSSPAERQLFGAAVALLDRPSAARVFATTATAEQLRLRGFKRADLVVCSPDAPEGMAARLEELRADLG